MRTKISYLVIPCIAAMAPATSTQASELFHKVYKPVPVPASALDAAATTPLAATKAPKVTTGREALVRPPKWSRTPKHIVTADGTRIERDNPPPPPEAVANSAASGVRWPTNDKDFRALTVPQRRVVWKEIKEVRKDREMPQTRGPWFTIDSREDRIARAASDAQYAIIVAQADSMMRQGSQGQEDAARGAKAVIATGAATVLIKKTMRRRRPYPNDHKFGSFPSGHTSTVFAMATVFSSAQPQQRIMALGSASLVG